MTTTAKPGCFRNIRRPNRMSSQKPAKRLRVFSAPIANSVLGTGCSTPFNSLSIDSGNISSFKTTCFASSSDAP